MKPPSSPDPASDPELDKLICDCIDMLLATLPPEEASIVQRVDVDGERPENVARSLGLGERTVADSLVRGRQALQARFSEMSRICPKHGLAGCDCTPANRVSP